MTRRCPSLPLSLLPALQALASATDEPPHCLPVDTIQNPSGIAPGRRRGSSQARELIVRGLAGVCPHPTLRDHRGVPVPAVRVTEEGRVVLAVESAVRSAPRKRIGRPPTGT